MPMGLRFVSSITPTDVLENLDKFKFEYPESSLNAISVQFRWLAERLDYKTPSEYFQANMSVLEPRMPPSQQTLRDYIVEHRENSSVDYSNPGTFICFDRTYFYRNFLKCLVAAHYFLSQLFRSEGINTFIDVGSGVGTFSIAAQLLKGLSEDKYVLIDESSYQLHLAQQLVAHLGFRNFSFLKSDAFTRFDRRGVRIASYWLCGNKDRVLGKTDEELSNILKDGMVVVDYQANINSFVNRIARLKRKMRTFEISASLPANVNDLVGSRSLNIYMLMVEPAKR
jgi:SAM-dependent methyltransferase